LETKLLFFIAKPNSIKGVLLLFWKKHGMLQLKFNREKATVEAVLCHLKSEYDIGTQASEE